ncbi:MAG: DnaJ domain-containing protein [Humidesulfovibrio sp.]|uniref:J domain-containing protein n=1 Tax=Humidesulfovibrio sp. TaxID=2910988 RepID=UPI00273235C8|nr:J domain-containing protein [Humidesulfovibrio sp.]MDP2848081.1 DnaJ domain-containing protein [Humidesulfovibrio sp.]
MNIRDCQRILQVSPNANLDEVKAAFRKLAFKLHPDLNPTPKAAEQFRELNEAYILLTRALKDEPVEATGQARSKAQEPTDAKTRKAQAGKAYARGAAQASQTAGANASSGGGFHFREEEVLRDLLTDPFARQVFEDIYSQLKHGHPRPGQTTHKAPLFQPPPPQQEGPTTNRRKLEITWGDKSLGLDLSKGLIGGVKSWLRGQLDDEQTVSYPAHAVGPGKLLRLTVSSRFGDPKTVEITLPPDFVVGRPIRLKGLGRKLGPFTGDLFLRVLAK